MSTPVLTCKNLSKSYGMARVLDDVNMSIPSGKIIGLLGPNGCGKSTLLKLITGLLTPDSGEIEICGQPRSDVTNAFVSYLPAVFYTVPFMNQTVFSNLAIRLCIFGCSIL